MKVLLLYLIFLIGQPAHAERLTTTVVDDAALFTPEQKIELEAKIQKLKDEGRWLVVHTVNDLASTSIEDYAEQSFKRWEIGEKGKDNGLLLVIALKDRKFRLEVGYGLEGEITDYYAQELLDNYLKPALKEGRPSDGVNAVIDQISIAAEATNQANEEWAKTLKEAEAFILVPNLKLTAEDTGAIAQAIIGFRPFGVKFLITGPDKGLDSLPAVAGEQRLVIEVRDTDIQISKDAEGFVTDQFVEEMRDAWSQGGHVGLVNTLWRIHVQEREKKAKLEREQQQAEYERLRAKAEALPFELYLALAFLLSLQWFVIARKTTQKSLVKIRAVALNAPVEVLPQIKAALRYLQLYPMLFILILSQAVYQRLMQNQLTLPWSELEFNVAWVIFPIFILVGLLVSGMFTLVVVQAICDLVFVRRLNALKATHPTASSAIDKILQAHKAEKRSYSGSGGGGGGGFGSSSSSSSSRSSSSSSGGGRSGGGGASGSW